MTPSVDEPPNVIQTASSQNLQQKACFCNHTTDRPLQKRGTLFKHDKIRLGIGMREASKRPQIDISSGGKDLKEILS